ncbi:FMN-linked oxidoreductase [Gymnopus androsaceus JB14]|uniref:FMN-linked oxidoreductase n=1 Tax=Gymnopus androsaceus JB14 TaxID=1447944 RepID=A0A6A4I4I0_9AGAR|nr:FMN-linked oxidoreductase [Gymnopus androsaceus JB14]
MRTTPSQAPIPGLVKEYYTQRATGGFAGIPGIWSDEQIQGWKEVADAVHAKGSYIFFQIVAIGRGANLSDLQADDPSFDVVGAGDIPDPAGGFFSGTIPRPLTKAEIDEYVETFSVAASNAVHKAGFDGFLRDTSNNRTDEYGGSIENRARFLLEITERVSKAVGEEKTAIRISPWLNERDLAMDDPIPTFSYAVTELKTRFAKLAYLHAIEPRVFSGGDVREIKENESNDFLKAIWSPRPLILAGGFVRDNAIEAAGTEGVLIAYGRHYIANPDLPYRLKDNIPLNKYDRSTFYIPGDASGRGYTDYSFATVEVNA